MRGPYGLDNEVGFIAQSRLRLLVPSRAKQSLGEVADLNTFPGRPFACLAPSADGLKTLITGVYIEANCAADLLLSQQRACLAGCGGAYQDRRKRRQSCRTNSD